MSKILIVEDDAFLSDVLLQKLQANGYATLLSRDGADALKKMRAERPDLVLLDIIGPKMNGFEVLEVRQGDATIASIPVIVISDSGQSPEINRALALGAKDYLVKTKFEPEEVIAKVRQQLQNDGAAVAKDSPKNAQTAPVSEGVDTLLGRKIMWVEDDEFLSEIIARRLVEHGCILLHATEGAEALRILGKEMPDLILLDILLSGMDGFEILKKIKEDARTRHIPVILLSNLGQKADIEKGKALGCARFLVKAMVTLDEIIKEMKEVLKEASSKVSSK